MQLVETTVSLTTVRMQLANYADPEKATEWVEFETAFREAYEGGWQHSTG